MDVSVLLQLLNELKDFDAKSQDNYLLEEILTLS